MNPLPIIPGLVSTIIPVFNRPEMLREAVKSVLAQSYRPVEVVIVDDGSTDDTWDVCLRLETANPGLVRSIRQTNGGPGSAREAGRALVRGEFIQYLDSDDRLLPRKFEEQVRALRNTPEAGVAYCYTRYLKIGGVSVERPWKRSGVTVELMFPTFLEERWWDTPTPLYRRSVCDGVGPWTKLSIEEDWEYDCRVAASNARLVHCKEFLVEVRDHEGARLCRGTPLESARMHERAIAHRLILSHALRAGVDVAGTSMQKFARELFLLARQCGATGLNDDARELFRLSREASGTVRAKALDFRVYSLAVQVFGWRLCGLASSWIDRWRDALENPQQAPL